MRNTSRYSIIIFALALIAGSFACTSRKSNAEHRDLIHEKDLIGILKDVHLTDGLLSMPGINYKYSYGDSLSSYIDVIEKHGYTKAQMDRTMRFYFVKKPKKLMKIYDKVLGSLSELESNLEKEIPDFRHNAQNMWTASQNYSFPDPAGKEMTPLDIPMPYTESYNLKFTLTLFPEDCIQDPFCDLYLSHTDTSGMERKIYLTTPDYIKDGRPHTYIIQRTNKLPPPVRLKGWFINSFSSAPGREMNHTITGIFLSPNRFN